MLVSPGSKDVLNSSTFILNKLNLMASESKLIRQVVTFSRNRKDLVSDEHIPVGNKKQYRAKITLFRLHFF